MYQLGNLLQETYDKDTCTHQNAFSELFDTAAPDTLNLRTVDRLNFILTQIPNDYEVQLPEHWDLKLSVWINTHMMDLTINDLDLFLVAIIILNTLGHNQELINTLHQKDTNQRIFLPKAITPQHIKLIKLVHRSVGTDAFMKLLLKEDSLENIPLHEYCSHNSKHSVEAVYRPVGVENFIQLLLQQGLNKTPLHVAARNGHHEIFECLLTLAKNDPKLRHALRQLFDQIGSNPFSTNQNCALALSQLIDFLYGQDSDEGAQKLDFSSTNNDDDDDNDDTPPEGVSITNIILATGVPGQPAPCAFFTNSK